jgi:hypothetical protein
MLGVDVATAQGHSITYRIALGSRRGQKAFTSASSSDVPLHQSPHGRHGTAVADRAGPHPLCIEDPVPGLPVIKGIGDNANVGH